MPMGEGAPATEQVERTRKLYRWVAPLYDPFRSLWSRWTRPAEEVLDRLFRERVGAGSRILELAPGTGINIARLRRIAPDFASYVGIDSSPQMLDRARVRARGDRRIRLVLADATDLSLLEGEFELVVCTWLLSHLDAPVETARGAIEKLAPGGSAVFVFFTAPRNALLRRLLEAVGHPGRYRFVETAPIEELPGLERRMSCAGGMATVAVFRRP